MTTEQLQETGSPLYSLLFVLQNLRMVTNPVKVSRGIANRKFGMKFKSMIVRVSYLAFNSIASTFEHNSRLTF